MADKFFETARDRFEYHRQHVERELEYLGYMDYDYAGKLSPDFKAKIDEIKVKLKEMEELIDQLPRG